MSNVWKVPIIEKYFKIGLLYQKIKYILKLPLKSEILVVKRWHTKCLLVYKQQDPYLCHLLSVCLWIKWCLSQQYGVFFRCHPQLVVECMVPDFLHVIPIGNNAMLNGVFHSQDTSFRLGFIPNIAVLLAHAHHYTLCNKSSELKTNLFNTLPQTAITYRNSTDKAGV